MRDDTRAYGELLEQFEYTLPVIKANTDEIRLETPRGCRGEITLRNAGGGVLEGNVASNLPALTFSPEYFTGNKVSVMYKFDIDIYKPGDVIDTSVIIMSNGGELVLPVHISVTARAYNTEDGGSLNSLRDFMEYMQNNPNEAARAFVSKEFGEWLASMDKGALSLGAANFMELYEHFKFDANKERAIDNFLFLHGLKKKSALSLIENGSELTLIPGSREAVAGMFTLRRDEWGYVEAEIQPASSTPWLNIITRRITAASFGRGSEAVVDYLVNPELLGGHRAMAKIKVKPSGGAPLEYTLVVKQNPILNVVLSKQGFGFNDEGIVQLVNNTGSDLVVEIMPRHDFIRFEGKRYLIGAQVDIPFKVHLTAARLNALPERGALVVDTEILVKTVYKGNVFTRQLSLGVTDLKGYL